jgi:hypothetical protein
MNKKARHEPGFFCAQQGAWCHYIHVIQPSPYVHVRAFGRIDWTLSAVDKGPGLTPA